MARTAVLVTSALAVAALGFQMSTAHGKHSWSNYHWKRGTAPVPFVLGHNLTDKKWDPDGMNETFLEQAAVDWKTQNEIDITGISNDDDIYSDVDAAKCEISNDYYGDPDGVIDVCSKEYGPNGWLGVAQIWVDTADGHIYEGVAKLNDTYFKSGTYDKPSWRDFVMCQEVGHVFGLGHQDESFYNPEKVDANGTKTCMDYTSRPEDNGQPNQHDYDQLQLIYNHNDEGEPDEVVDTGPGKGNGGGPKKGQGSVPGKLVSVSGFQFATYVRNDPSEWGTAVAFTDKGQPRVFVNHLDSGVTVVTHVTWTEDARAGAHFPHQH